MLFDCWSQLVARHPSRMALRRDDGSALTFAELDRLARTMVNERADGLWVARGGSQDFLPTVLAAWRKGEAVILTEGEPREIRCPIPPGTRLIKQSCGAAGLERSLFFSEEAIVAEGKRNVAGLGLHPERPGVAALSLAHSYGFGCLALPLLLHGIPLKSAASPLPAFLEEILAPGEPCFLPGVPTMWKTWWQTGLTRHRAIDLAISAGAPLSLELEGGIFEEHGLKLHNFYGTSETGAIAYDHSSSPRRNASEVGELLRDLTVQCDDDGRILVSSDACACGADELRFEGEFSSINHRTSDVGSLSGNRLFLTAHVGAAINVAGRKVSPRKITRAIESCSGVISSEVTGVASRDFERFQEIAATVRVNERFHEASLKGELRQSLAAWEIPRQWVFKKSG